MRSVLFWTPSEIILSSNETGKFTSSTSTILSAGSRVTTTYSYSLGTVDWVETSTCIYDRKTSSWDCTSGGPGL